MDVSGIGTWGELSEYFYKLVCEIMLVFLIFFEQCRKPIKWRTFKTSPGAIFFHQDVVKRSSKISTLCLNGRDAGT